MRWKGILRITGRSIPISAFSITTFKVQAYPPFSQTQNQVSQQSLLKLSPSAISFTLHLHSLYSFIGCWLSQCAKDSKESHSLFVSHTVTRFNTHSICLPTVLITTSMLLPLAGLTMIWYTPCLTRHFTIRPCRCR